MLELSQLRVSCGGVEVLHGIEFSLSEGETVGIIGPNGAGKTTLLRTICGLLTPDSGEVRLQGRDLTALAPEQICRIGVALVPAGRHVFKTLTVAENLRLAAQGVGGEGEQLERTRASVPILRRRWDLRADRLSGGEQQQLAIARALLTRPRLLILDEPSLGLAPKTIDVIYALLQGLRDEGVTMLLVEQNAARTIDFCDRCAVIAGGGIRAEGSRRQLRDDPDLLRSYLGGGP